MAQRLQELCALLVEDTCGTTCSQIFSTLAEQGRLSRQQLQQLTRIPGRQLRHALVVLTQQHIILHHTNDGEATFYQVDWRNTYYLIRSNRIISLVEDRYGEGAGKIIANLLQLGHARVGDLAQAFDLELTTKRDSGIEGCNEHVNGNAKVNGVGANHASHKAQADKITTVGQFHGTLRKLLGAGFLVKLSKRTYTPAADFQHEIEELVISEQFPDRKVNGPKKQAEFKAAVNQVKRKWRDADAYSDNHDVQSKGTMYRAGAKRAKLTGGMTNGNFHDNDNFDEENVPKLPNEMVLKVNYAQCTLAFRSERLEQLAETYLGGVTAAVYGALLQALEAKLKGKDDEIQVDDKDEDEDEDLPTAETVDVERILDPNIDLSLGIAGVKTNEFADIGIKPEEGSEDEDGYGTDSHLNRGALIGEHLKLLEEHPKGFCRRVGGAGRGEWKVSFPSLTQTLIQTDVDNTVLARYGKIHARIIRILRERGRLDGKQIAALSMMRAKDVHAILTELQYAGLVESQEIPKDSTRQPGRSIYLYFHDSGRVANLILQQTYQAMSRMLQRLREEREKYRGAIEKVEQYKFEDLEQNEKAAVGQWREVEEKMLAQVQRMDDLVALLRDFSGKDSSLVS